MCRRLRSTSCSHWCRSRAAHSVCTRPPNKRPSGRPGRPNVGLSGLLLVRIVAERDKSHADVRDGIAADTAERLPLEVAVLQADLEVADVALIHLPPVADGDLLDRAGVGDTGGPRAGQAVATAVVVQRAAVTDGGSACGVGVGRSAGLLFAGVEVHGHGRNRLQEQAGEGLPLADRGNGAVRTDRRVRQLCRAVTTVAGAGQPACLELQIRTERQDHARTDAAGPGGVVGARGGSRRAVTESTAQAVELIVAEARIHGNLGNDVGREIDRVLLVGIEQAATGIGDDVRGRSGAARGSRRGYTVTTGVEAGLRTLDRNTGREYFADALHETQLRVAGPVEARDVLRVDRLRNLLGARILLGGREQGREAPALSGKQVPLGVGVAQRAVEVAHAQRIAVALR